MFSFSPVLLALSVLLSYIASFGNVNALPIIEHVAVPSGVMGQFNLSRQSLLESLTNYTDENVTEDPTVFINVTAFEFLEELKLEGLDSSEEVVESHSDSKYEDRLVVPVDCEKFTKTTYYYYRCTDPLRREVRFTEYKGIGYCPPRRPRTGRTHRRRLSPSSPRASNHRTFALQRRTYSPRYSNRPAERLRLRYRLRGHGTFIGYRFIRKHTTKLCGATYGRFLQQVVSEFVLKGKKSKYQKLINRTFQRIRRRYRGFGYVIQSETFEKNGRVYVRFFFNEKHTGEAEY